MLEMGVLPEVAAATSATMILFTSLSACVVFVSFGAVQVGAGRRAPGGHRRWQAAGHIGRELWLGSLAGPPTSDFSRPPACLHLSVQWDYAAAAFALGIASTAAGQLLVLWVNRHLQSRSLLVFIMVRAGAAGNSCCRKARLRGAPLFAWRFWRRWGSRRSTPPSRPARPAGQRAGHQLRGAGGAGHARHHGGRRGRHVVAVPRHLRQDRAVGAARSADGCRPKLASQSYRAPRSRQHRGSAAAAAAAATAVDILYICLYLCIIIFIMKFSCSHDL